MFTVRDAENAMQTFSIFATAVMIGIFFQELLVARGGIVSCLYAIASHVSHILPAATLLTLLIEGSDIMFLRRTREELSKLKAERQQFREEIYQKVLEEVEAWNTHRLEAESRGESFNEPLPGSDRPKHKKRRFLFF